MKHTTLFTALFVTSALVACGGGGSGSSTSNTPTAAGSSSSAATTAVAQGMITGFGSVIVNGVHFDVKDAAIDVDGSSDVESGLAVGQMVQVNGTIDADGVHGKATSLSAESRLRAPIESIDLTNGVITVLGETVLINGDTFYEDGITATDLKVGDVIRVAGSLDANGNLVATRIDVVTGDAAKEIFLVGAVSNLDTTAMTFTLNGTTVDYSKATISDLPNKTIANDLMVRVHGTVVNGVLVADGNVHLSSLDLKHDGEADTKLDVGMVGLVTNLLADTSFTLGDITVLINSNTVFDDGSASDLNNGLTVKVKGKFDANHNLLASKIKLIQNAQVDDEGLVQATDLTANTFTLNGVTFNVTVDTSFVDHGKSKVRLFGLKDLVTGDYIDVRGYRIAATATTPEQVIATRVERKKIEDKNPHGFQAEIKGTVESVTDSTLVVAGHSILIAGDTTIAGFKNMQLFLASALGLKVEIHAVVVNGVITARTVAIDNDSESEHSSSSNASSSNSSDSSSSTMSSSSATSSSSEASSASSDSSASSNSSASSSSSSSV